MGPTTGLIATNAARSALPKRRLTLILPDLQPLYSQVWCTPQNDTVRSINQEDRIEAFLRARVGVVDQ